MYAFIKHSVGKNGKNLKDDVMAIQARLDIWIYKGLLPDVDYLAVDGVCGPKTKRAIGAFQKRYVVGITNPDCRVDAGGKTQEHLWLPLFSQPRVPDPVYYQYLSFLDWYIKVADEPPVWEKRGMFWFGVGAKASAGVTGQGGTDVSLSSMYNLKAPSANKFIVTAHTERKLQLGAGFSGGAVLCFATGLYYPQDLGKIQTAGVDFNLNLMGKWASLARWAVKLPYMGGLITAARAAAFADLGTLSKIATAIKGGLGAFGLREDETMPNFTAIDIPIGGGGVEASIYYGVTSYSVSKLVLA